MKNITITGRQIESIWRNGGWCLWLSIRHESGIQRVPIPRHPSPIAPVDPPLLHAPILPLIPRGRPSILHSRTNGILNTSGRYVTRWIIRCNRDSGRRSLKLPNNGRLFTRTDHRRGGSRRWARSGSGRTFDGVAVILAGVVVVRDGFRCGLVVYVSVIGIAVG